MAAGKPVWTIPLGATGPLGSVAISPDGRTAAVAWQPDHPPGWPPTVAVAWDVRPRVELVDLEAGKVVRTLVAPAGAPGLVRFSPDGKRLALAGAARGVHLFDLGRQAPGGPPAP